MSLMDYKADQGWCNRCSNCKWIPSYRIKKTETMYICPAITKYNFNAYSGCGKLEIGYSINDGHSTVCKTTQDVAYKCTYAAPAIIPVRFSAKTLMWQKILRN